MDIKSVTNLELVKIAFGLSAAQAVEAHEQIFRPVGYKIALDSSAVDAQSMLAAAIELDRRIALREMEDVKSPDDAKELIKRVIGGQQHESFWVVYLDAQLKVLSSEEAFRGTVSQTSVYPREIAKRAMQLNASSVMLAHNHPSGTDTPSRADQALTANITATMELVDVRVIDHFVITRNSINSFVKMGLL